MLAVAVYVVIAYTGIVSADPGPTPGDQAAFDIADNIAAAWLTDVAKVVTWLGSAGVTLLVGLIAAVFLALGARGAALAVLVVAMVIIYVGVPELKGRSTGRGRRTGLVDARAESFPSGHAAHAVMYAWLALITAIAVRARIRRDGAARGRRCIRRGGRALPRLPARALPERRHRRLGAGRGGVRRLRVVALVGIHLRDNPADP